ncbi:MAG: zinc ribbon domain-containing protein [Candidatus Bathyarchaeota archaeon]|nr:zinc ribbon domain-containing protein [Candidatus Bathyarchaeota archaeon]
MPYCPKCGNEVDENMTFCPRCGAPLKMEAVRPTPPPSYHRNEKSEKDEKQEKNEPEKGEKGEKNEKGEHGYIGLLIGGIVIITFGLLAFFRATGYWRINSAFEGPIIMLIIGVVIIIVAVYYSMTGRRRHPAPA